jgi:hypothetical protein
VSISFDIKKRTGSFGLVRFYHAVFIPNILKQLLSMKNGSNLKKCLLCKTSKLNLAFFVIMSVLTFKEQSCKEKSLRLWLVSIM